VLANGLACSKKAAVERAPQLLGGPQNVDLTEVYRALDQLAALAVTLQQAASAGLGRPKIYFSILQRKAISPADFANLDDLATRILAFQARYNATATPFDWTYTRADLNQFLTRLRRHDHQESEPANRQAA
jgi:hypothetical protein